MTLIIITSHWHYGPFRGLLPTAGLTSTCLQIEMKYHIVNLGIMWSTCVNSHFAFWAGITATNQQLSKFLRTLR